MTDVDNVKKSGGDDAAAMLEHIEYQSLLYDFYGPLLGESQREVMDLYHEDDMSLSEIAEELGQTRQGVHYTLKKAEAALTNFEDKLGLVHAMAERTELAGEAETLLDGMADEGNADSVARLREIIRRLAEM